MNLNIEKDKNGIYKAPGLIDLQVNGTDGVDFNDLSLQEEGVLKASKALLNRGITTYFPTVITNSEERIIKLISIIRAAYDHFPLVKEMVGGLHIEGPFISPKDGAKGAHDAQFIQAPDIAMMKRFQDAAGGLIKLVTIAPEWEGTEEFVQWCGRNKILVSMGHSLAETQDIQRAVKAGLSLSTHLGNGVPLMIKRHPNLIWDQLAEESLYAMIITDGHHIPDNFIKVVRKIKKEKTIVVSDSTQFAGMAAGEYKTHIGGEVVLSEEKRLSVKGGGGILAGAAKNLLECVETLIEHQLESVENAWGLASVNVIKMLSETFPEFKEGKDSVEFLLENDKIKIKKVIKNGELLVNE